MSTTTSAATTMTMITAAAATGVGMTSSWRKGPDGWDLLPTQMPALGVRSVELQTYALPVTMSSLPVEHLDSLRLTSGLTHIASFATTTQYLLALVSQYARSACRRTFDRLLSLSRTVAAIAEQVSKDA